MTRIRIAIVDDQALVREGLAALLALTPDLAVVGTVADGPATLDLVAEQRPDVVLMDVRMPGMSGVAATREIHARHPRPASSQRLLEGGGQLAGAAIPLGRLLRQGFRHHLVQPGWDTRVHLA